MRTVIFAAAFYLLAPVAASAHWPVTYVGNPGMHRVDGAVRQVTLAQPHAGRATIREGQRLDRKETTSKPAFPSPTASEREFEIRRYGRKTQQVTLVTSADEKLSELLRSNEPDAEYAIRVGSFLREPEPTEELFTNDEWFAPELERTSHRGRLVFGGAVIGR